MKGIIWITLVIASLGQVYGQVQVRLLVSQKFGNHIIGDTLKAIGFKYQEDTYSPSYLIKEGNQIKSVEASKFSILDKLDFWDQVWFYNCSENILKNGWNLKQRQILSDNGKDFIFHLNQNKLLFNDEYLKDYLLQLSKKIMPGSLIKNIPSTITIDILMSDNVECYAFDNGTIVLSTEAIANCKTEKELVRILGKEIAFIVMDYNLMNMQNQSNGSHNDNFWNRLIAYDAQQENSFDNATAVDASAQSISNDIARGLFIKPTEDQISKCERIASDFLNHQPDRWCTVPDSLTNKISTVLTYTAWSDFYAEEYVNALQIIDRIENGATATADDYLLKAKIYRTLYNTEESNYEALSYLKKAAEISENIIDIQKEEALIYLRLGDKQKARESFENYRNLLLDIQSKGGNEAEEILWVENILAKGNL